MSLLNATELRTDVLVIGGGIAGQLAALTARRRGADVVLAHWSLGASPFILGANVADLDRGDSLDQHGRDMIEAGRGLCDPRLVAALVENAPNALTELLSLGAPFERDEAGPRRRHLSGNRNARSVYVAGGTGRAILRTLGPALDAAGVVRRPGLRAIDLLHSEAGIGGAVLLDMKRGGVVVVRAAAVVLASGGIGRLYDDSTYPADVAGDSYALALRAGATLRDMEFVQFEPTVVVRPDGCRGMEMPTAMLGDGAVLRNSVGERFMFRSNPDHGEKRIEKARMALAIQHEIDEGRGVEGEGVLFDTTVLAPEVLEGYVTHVARLRRAGLDPSRAGALVRPAAHSLMGGVRISANGSTDVPGLFAAGEAAGGVHGASRIAGNGGGEVLAFGLIVGRAAAAHAAAGLRRPDPDTTMPAAGVAPAAAESAVRELRGLMSAHCGIRRRGDQLEAALRSVRSLRASWDRARPGWNVEDIGPSVTAESALVCAEAILASAILRKESRGAHQRTDHPEELDGVPRANLVTMIGNGEIVVRPEPGGDAPDQRSAG